MPTATLTSKGQLTLPRKVRDALRLKPGDQIEFILEADGEVRLRAGRYDVRELEGLLRRPGRKPVPLAVMDETIARRGER